LDSSYLFPDFKDNDSDLYWFSGDEIMLFKFIPIQPKPEAWIEGGVIKSLETLIILFRAKPKVDVHFNPSHKCDGLEKQFSPAAHQCSSKRKSSFVRNVIPLQTATNTANLSGSTIIFYFWA